MYNILILKVELFLLVQPMPPLYDYDYDRELYYISLKPFLHVD